MTHKGWRVVNRQHNQSFNHQFVICWRVVKVKTKLNKPRHNHPHNFIQSIISRSLFFFFFFCLNNICFFFFIYHIFYIKGPEADIKTDLENINKIDKWNSLDMWYQLKLRYQPYVWLSAEGAACTLSLKIGLLDVYKAFPGHVKRQKN